MKQLEPVLLGTPTNHTGTASDWNTGGQKWMDKVLSVSTVLVCPGSIDYFLDRVQELSHQNDRVVPILVANMLICL